jgi:aminopeptidase N
MVTETTSEVTKQEEQKALHLADYRPPEYFTPDIDLTFNIISETRVEVSARLYVQKNTAEYGSETLPIRLYCPKETDIRSVQVDGNLLEASNWDHKGDELIIWPVKDAFQLRIATTLNPKENKSGSGLYATGSGMLTQCEAEGFRKITPSVDRPDNMGTYTTTIIADKKKHPILLSNGNLVEQKDLPEGRHCMTYEDPFAKPSYLFALVAGDLDCIEDTFTTMSGRKVKLKVYMEKGDRDLCLHAMESLKKAMKHDEDRWGLEYALDEYKIVATHDFNSGAMENRGLNIFNTSCLYADQETATDADFENVERVVAHEYEHDKTGNDTTCRDWFQLTLKEGLTVFRDQEFSSDMHNRSLTRIDDARLIKIAQFAEDTGGNAHPIRPQEVGTIRNFYTTTVYYKGAEVIRMIHTLIGEEKFKEGLQLYLKRHFGEAVTCEEFVAAMQEVSGTDLTHFKETWYNQKGTPVCKVEQEYKESTQTYTLTIEQDLPYDTDKPYHFPFSFGLIGPDGQDLKSGVLSIHEKRQSFTFENIPTRPVLSPLRSFSAPMKLHIDQSDAELCHLMAHDSDGYNKFDAAQRIAKKELQSLVARVQAGEEPKINQDVLRVYRSVLANAHIDPGLTARMIASPAMRELVQDMEIYDYEAVHKAREAYIKALAQAHEEELVDLYQKNHDTGPYQKDGESIAKRSLKNAALGVLSRLGDRHIDLIKAQYESANNMTDEEYAFVLLCNADQQYRDPAIKSFYINWKDNKLTFNKWIENQALSDREDILEHVKELEKSPEFDPENANCIRALYRYFAANKVHYHAKDGKGYVFLADQVIRVNQFNAEIAAGLVKGAFDELTKMDKERQVLMRAQLERIKENAKSKDVQEVVGRILG